MNATAHIAIGAGIALLVFAAVAYGRAPNLAPDDIDTRRAAILHAIRIVESGDRDNPPDGDGGKATGPYQIHRAYFTDAADFDATLRSGRWEDCRDRAFAELVVSAYMQRWCPAAWETADAETVAKTHNGGPRGPLRDSTLPYWRKVKAVLDREGTP